MVGPKRQTREDITPMDINYSLQLECMHLMRIYWTMREIENMASV